MATVEEKLEILRKEIETLTKQFRELTDVYKSTILKETQSMRTFMEEALDAVKREVAEALRNMKQQPDVHHEIYEPDFPLYGRLYEKGVLKGSIYRGKLKVDADAFIRKLIRGELTTLEKVAGLKLLTKRGGAS